MGDGRHLNAPGCSALDLHDVPALRLQSIARYMALRSKLVPSDIGEIRYANKHVHTRSMLQRSGRVFRENCTAGNTPACTGNAAPANDRDRYLYVASTYGSLDI